MSRIAFSLLLLLPAMAFASEGTSVPDGSDCPEARSASAGSEHGAGHAEPARPRGESTAAPRLQGDAGTERLPTPSWRSFLPGMLR